ncbi:integrin alpha-8-like [Saccostrea echinata]|uniref:integrin alpha-8-like n=1 Tax=Saccostrea echinata TaxID=191078 RepID=UPI002A83A177|nr:integrin alpha-8-like [Saccostrea echinata]
MLLNETCLLFALIPVISAFNVGIKGAKILTGKPGSMFGYSIDFATRGNNVWLLIGSPKEDDYGINMKTGALYFCLRGFNDLSDCRTVPAEQVLSPGVGFTEDRSDMWLGASVVVGTDANAVTFCGPRWMKNSFDNNTRAMNGLCYEVTFGFLEEGNSGFLDPEILSGLYNSDADDQFPVAEGSAANLTIRYGVSSSGLSIKYYEGDVLVGSPGLNDLAGGILRVKGSGYSVKAMNTTASKQGQMYGYDISIGRFYGDGQYYFAIGGPRDGGSGKVLITDSEHVVKETLVGIEPGSYFGSVLCVVPGIGAATDRLLVGAPLYSDMQTYSNNYNINENQGQVYVYWKNQSNNTLEKKQSLDGSSSRSSKFGSAMANVDDLNNDNYNDVVIGAPFESDGQGAVYVYMGYKRGFYLTQTITAASVAPSGTTLSTFGSSFSQHSVDFNNDKHRDIAIGAYGSAMVFVLYTNRPITMRVDTRTNLVSSPGGSKFIIGHNTTEFTFNVCFEYEGDNIPTDVLVTYKVTVDTTFLHTSASSQGRVCFNQPETCSNTMSRSITIFKASSEFKCPDPPLYVVVQDDWTNMRGLFVPVDFDVEFNVSTTSNRECTVSCPIVNKFDPTNDDPFSKTRKYSYELERIGCGEDNICQPDIKISVSSPESIITGPQAEYVIDITINNEGETSYDTAINVTFHSNLTLANTGNFSEDFPVTCSPAVGSVQCFLGRQQLKTNEMFSFRITLDSRRLLPVIDEFEMKVEVKSSRNDNSMESKMYNKTIKVLTVVAVTYNIASVPEVYITKTAPESPIVEVYHSIQIVNTGPSDLLDILKFTLEYPQSSQVKPTKILLNVSSANNNTLVRCQNVVLEPEGETNLTYRAFTIPINKTRHSESASNFDCEKSEMCSKLECDIGTFMYDSFISVVISYDVIQNLYAIINDGASGDIPFVPIETTFTPYTENPGLNLKGQGDGLVKVVTKFLPSSPMKKEVPVWAIVLPIVISLVILVVVVLVLKKRGFFVRKYKVQIEDQRAREKKIKENDRVDNLVGTDDEVEEKPVLSTFVNTNKNKDETEEDKLGSLEDKGLEPPSTAKENELETSKSVVINEKELLLPAPPSTSNVEFDTDTQTTSNGENVPNVQKSNNGEGVPGDQKTSNGEGIHYTQTAGSVEGHSEGHG